MFKVGDQVVYPSHGAGTVEGIEEKTVLGKRRIYLIIQMLSSDLTVSVPEERALEVGLRPVITEAEIAAVYDILTSEQTEMESNWNKRFRANMEKIKGGDIAEVADVYRNLFIRDRERGLSTGERKMLSDVQQMLISELALASGKETDVIQVEVNECIS
ncbi:CarD family transcriptional regulator [Gottschalkiaceae bacterium SANA]|nr:CarD family transcriptional regulator [Gottschalkiaceae bacterium SANA]